MYYYRNVYIYALFSAQNQSCIHGKILISDGKTFIFKPYNWEADRARQVRIGRQRGTALDVLHRIFELYTWGFQ